MLRSLEEEEPAKLCEADVIVVGAGLAGMFLADRLAVRGIRVLVLESGIDAQTGDTHPLNAVDMTGACYMGAEHGRFRGLGGTSSRWGAALLPYLEADLGHHPSGWHTGWGISSSELAATLDNAETTFGVGANSYEGEEDLKLLLPDFLPRLPKWPHFRKRNTANLFADRIRCDPLIQIWTGATVTSIRMSADRAEGVVARSLSGNVLEAKAPCVTLAAGAIETTRLLLLMNREYGGKIFSLASPLGQGFHDHLSAPIAELRPADRNKIARLFGFRFVKGGMRSLRFELAPEVRVEEGLAAAFLHVAFSRDDKSGFIGLRNAFQAVQKGKIAALSDIGLILRDLPWFARAVWWRVVEQRICPPSESKFELHLVTEQQPHPEQRIGLSAYKVDPLGLPLASIDWHVHESDLLSFRRIADLAIARWRAGELEQLATLRPFPEDEVKQSLLAGGGIYHPAGTTRIGTNAESGVVDSNLNVYGVPGLRALATSVFPSVGGSSPSLALVQLAVRLANDISHDFEAIGIR